MILSGVYILETSQVIPLYIQFMGDTHLVGCNILFGNITSHLAFNESSHSVNQIMCIVIMSSMTSDNCAQIKQNKNLYVFSGLINYEALSSCSVFVYVCSVDVGYVSFLWRMDVLFSFVAVCPYFYMYIICCCMH